MLPLYSQLRTHPIAYITKDLERATGLELTTQGYYIISNTPPFAKSSTKNNPNTIFIDSEHQLDTAELLAHPRTQEVLKDLGVKHILVFKNTPQIERLAHEFGYTLLNPSATLANTVEEKLSQVNWLGDLASTLYPPFEIKTCQEVVFTGTPFVLQFNRTHTGLGTFFIEQANQLDELKARFPHRPVKITQFIQGYMLTSNNVVSRDTVIAGNLSYQITGLYPFTDKPFATIGNDWAFPHQILTSKQIETCREMAITIGKKLQTDGWRGLFGLDLIVDALSGQVFLIEINARQPASTSFESYLQRQSGLEQTSYTTFEAHLSALLDLLPEGTTLTQVVDGAQLVRRVLSKDKMDPELIPICAGSLREAGFLVTVYNNTDVGTDLMRIQSQKTLMREHNRLNPIGTAIAAMLF